MFGYFNDGIMNDRERQRQDPSFWTGTSSLGIVTSAHYRATEAGAAILSQGGNAVDAAVATSLALGVVEPAGSGLGGMTMMMIHLAEENRTFILEGPCRAPVAANPGRILELAEDFKKRNPKKVQGLNDEEVAGMVRKSGYHAVAVPTNAAVLGYALKSYGTLTSLEVVKPAVRLAEDGVTISPFQVRLLNEYCGQILRGNASRFIFGNESTPPDAGFLLRQPLLANTLKRLGYAGFEDFYTGNIGRTILEDMKENGGFITDEDFHTIPWPTEREPLKAAFKDWSIVTMPPPGGGIVLIEMLNLFQELANDCIDPDSPEAALLFASIIRKARKDRRKYNLGNVTRSGKKAPDLTSTEYAKITAMKLRRQIEGSGETSHFNVIDRFGNIVAVTQSIERSYGAKVATPELGFLYNGFIKGFKLKNRQHPHFLCPGAVARSNACPAIVFENRTPKYAIGSTGSERMISGIFQVLVRLRSQSSFKAVAAPRLHCSPENEIYLEAGRFSPEALKLLRKHAFTLIPYDEWAFSAGGLHLAGIDAEKFWGVADPRRDGAALGPVSY